jgi:hypothetical protein
MNHEEVAELMRVFALEAVDGQDKDAVRQHLGECHRCQAELADFHEVAGLLANTGGMMPSDSGYSAVSDAVTLKSDFSLIQFEGCFQRHPPRSAVKTSQPFTVTYRELQVNARVRAVLDVTAEGSTLLVAFQASGSKLCSR